MASTFSNLSAGLTNLNKKMSIGQFLGGAGPLGFNKPRKELRVEADKLFGVPPREGDPGYIPPPSPLTPTPVTPMPIPGMDDLSNIAERRRSVEEMLRRRGRLSTVLSNANAEPLGG